MTEIPTGPNGEDRRKATSQSELLAAAASLQKATEGLTEGFEGVKAFSRETRRIATQADKNANRIKIVVLVQALVIIGLIINSVYTAQANTKAARNAEYARATCDFGNQFRSDSKDLFDFISKLIATPPEGKKKQSSGELAFVAQLNAKVAETYKLRDCAVATGQK